MVEKAEAQLLVQLEEHVETGNELFANFQGCYLLHPTNWNTPKPNRQFAVCQPGRCRGLLILLGNLGICVHLLSVRLAKIELQPLRRSVGVSLWKMVFCVLNMWKLFVTWKNMQLA